MNSKFAVNTSGVYRSEVLSHMHSLTCCEAPDIHKRSVKLFPSCSFHSLFTFFGVKITGIPYLSEQAMTNATHSFPYVVKEETFRI